MHPFSPLFVCTQNAHFLHPFVCTPFARIPCTPSDSRNLHKIWTNRYMGSKKVCNGSVEKCGVSAHKKYGQMWAEKQENVGIKCTQKMMVKYGKIWQSRER